MIEERINEKEKIPELKYKRAVIVSAKRSPMCTSFGEKIPPEEGGDGKKKYPGAYAHLSTDYILTKVFEEVIEDSGVDEDEFDDVLVGCVSQKGDQGGNIARFVALLAGLPEEVPAATINRLCASSMYAVMSAAEAIISGGIWKNKSPEMILVGGLEHMGKYDINEVAEPSDFVYDEYLKDNIAAVSMGITAEKLAEMYAISKEQQHDFAYLSHQKTLKAIEEGKFKDEIVPIDLLNGKYQEVDTGPRKYASREAAEKLFQRLPTPFKKKGTVTPAGSSLISDGVAGLIVTSEQYADDNGLDKLAYINSWACAGVDPNIMGYGPVPATEIALARAGLSLDDMDVIELNEAFAAQSIAVLEHGWGIKTDGSDPRYDKININGGALALGHPLGCSGARIITTLVHEMQKQDVKYGLATMCVGFGQGGAIILEKPE